MRIAVAGGTGAVGFHVARAIRARGHEPVVLARATGWTSWVGTTSAAGSVAFFEATTTNLLRAERELGIGHHVARSSTSSRSR